MRHTGLSRGPQPSKDLTSGSVFGAKNARADRIHKAMTRAPICRDVCGTILLVVEQKGPIRHLRVRWSSAPNLSNAPCYCALWWIEFRLNSEGLPQDGSSSSMLPAHPPSLRQPWSAGARQAPSGTVRVSDKWPPTITASTSRTLTGRVDGTSGIPG